MGQYNDLSNPCALMVYMGAIANGGTAAVPRLVLKTENALGLPSLPALPRHTKKLVEGDTAAALAELMAHNVTAQYGASRFPNMDVCAKSGTAEVGAARPPHAWFAGFLRNPDAPYAFVVLVENGGSGADAAAPWRPGCWTRWSTDTKSRPPPRGKAVRRGVLIAAPVRCAGARRGSPPPPPAPERARGGRDRRSPPPRSGRRPPPLLLHEVLPQGAENGAGDGLGTRSTGQYRTPEMRK